MLVVMIFGGKKADFGTPGLLLPPREDVPPVMTPETARKFRTGGDAANYIRYCDRYPGWEPEAFLYLPETSPCEIVSYAQAEVRAIDEAGRIYEFRRNVLGRIVGYEGWPRPAGPAPVNGVHRNGAIKVRTPRARKR